MSNTVDDAPLSTRQETTSQLSAHTHSYRACGKRDRYRQISMFLYHSACIVLKQRLVVVIVHAQRIATCLSKRFYSLKIRRRSILQQPVSLLEPRLHCGASNLAIVVLLSNNNLTSVLARITTAYVK